MMSSKETFLFRLLISAHNNKWLAYTAWHTMGNILIPGVQKKRYYLNKVAFLSACAEFFFQTSYAYCPIFGKLHEHCNVRCLRGFLMS